MPSRDRVKSLIALVEQGKFVEAIAEFYAADASMQENLQPPRKGLDVLLAGEQKVLAAYKEVRTLPVKFYLIEGDRVVINWVFEFVSHDGRSFLQDELACQRWSGEKIAEERFYYDPGQQKFLSPTV